MYVRIYVHTGIRMVKKKLTLSLEGDLLDEVKGIAAIRGRSLSGIVEEYLEYLVFERWAEALGKELDLGDLEPTTESEISGSRPKGLDAAAAVRELRERRVKNIAGS
jgi:hypothetical protein